MVKSYLRFEPFSTFGVIASGNNVIWLPDKEGNAKSGGRALVAGLEDLLVWDLKSSTLLQKLSEKNQKGEISIIAYDGNNDLAAAGYSNGSVVVWDLKSGTVVVTFTGHRSSVTCLKFDTLGTRLVSGSKDSNVVVWDLIQEVGICKLRGHRNQITGLELVGDEEDHLVTVSKDGLIKLWDLTAQHSLETHVAHSGECWCLGASVDKSVLVTCGQSKEVRVWTLDLNAEENSKLHQIGLLEKHSAEKGQMISFHPTESYFGISSSDRSIEIFRQRTAEEIKKAVARRKKRNQKKLKEDALKEESLSEKSAIEESAELDVSEVYISSGIVRPTARVRGFCWTSRSRKGHIDLLASLSNNSLEVFKIPIEQKKNDTGYDKLITVDGPGHRSDIRALSISDDGKMVVSASSGLLKVWNLRTGNCLRTRETGYVLCASFLPGSTLVVAGTKTGTLELHDIASSSLLTSVDAHEGQAIWSLDVSADGQSLITGGANKKVNFWRFVVEQQPVLGTTRTIAQMTFKLTRMLELTDDVLAVKFSPDGKLVAASLLDNTIKVYFADNLKFFLSLYGHKLPVLSLDISHDSKLLISSSADKNIKIWGLDFGDCHRSLFAHKDSVMKVEFEPETHNFFSVSKDKLLKYWDGDKFVNIQTLSGHHSEIWALAVSKTADFVVTGSHDKSIRVWERTEEPLFIEEEREKELEEMYESNLLQENGIDVDEKMETKEDEDNVERAGIQTMETLKAGEKLMEALEIGATDLENFKEFEKRKLNEPNLVFSGRNPILGALNLSAERYVLNVLEKIKPQHLEDAILVLPFEKIVSLFKFMEIWSGNGWNMPLICRVFTFTLSKLHKQIIAAQSILKPIIIGLNANLRLELKTEKDQIGFNLAGLDYIKQTWGYLHKKEFLDDDKQRDHEQQMMKKRQFTTV